MESSNLPQTSEQSSTQKQCVDDAVMMELTTSKTLEQEDSTEIVRLSSKLPTKRSFVDEFALELILIFFVFPSHLLSTPLGDVFMNKACRYHLKYNETVCNQLEEYAKVKEEVQILSNYYSTLRSIVATIPDAAICLIAGQYMSRYGMRGPLLLAIAGRAFSAFLHAWAFYDLSTPLKYNVLAEIPAAFTGDTIVVMAAVYSHITLRCSPVQRSNRFLLIQFVVFIPLLSAMSIGGYLYDDLNISMFNLQLATGIAFLLPLLLLFTIYTSPEMNEEARNDSWRDVIRYSIGLAVIRQSFRYAVKPRPNCARAQLYCMFACIVISVMAFSGHSELTYYYVNRIYSWSVSDFTRIGAIANALTLAIAVPNLLLFRWLGFSDATMAAICFACYSLKFALLSAASLSVNLFYAQIVAGLPFMVLNISMRAHTSKLLPFQEVSVVFAAISSLEHLFPIVSDTINMILYRWAVSFFPGLPYVLYAILFLVAVILASLCARWVRLYGYPIYGNSGKEDRPITAREKDDMFQDFEHCL